MGFTATPCIDVGLISQASKFSQFKPKSHVLTIEVNLGITNKLELNSILWMNFLLVQIISLFPTHDVGLYNIILPYIIQFDVSPKYTLSVVMDTKESPWCLPRKPVLLLSVSE